MKKMEDDDKKNDNDDEDTKVPKSPADEFRAAA